MAVLNNPVASKRLVGHPCLTLHFVIRGILPGQLFQCETLARAVCKFTEPSLAKVSAKLELLR